MKRDKFPYDRTLRELILRLPMKLTEILMGSEVKAILNSNFPSVDERKADFVAKLKNDKIIHIEIQVQNDPDLLERLIDCSLKIKKVYGQYPIPIILWIGEGIVPYQEVNILGNITFKCTVIDIKEIDCNVLLESEDPNDNILAVLCRRSEGFWRKLSERLMKLPISKRKSYMRKLFYLVKLRKDIFDEYENLKKEVPDMPVVLDIKNDPAYKRGHERGLKLGIKRGLKKGIKKGIEKGLEKGVEKGLILRAQEDIIDALMVKFYDIDEELKRQIELITDRDILKKILKLVIQVQSIEEFKQKVYSMV